MRNYSLTYIKRGFAHDCVNVYSKKLLRMHILAQPSLQVQEKKLERVNKRAENSVIQREDQEAKKEIKELEDKK